MSVCVCVCVCVKWCVYVCVSEYAKNGGESEVNDKSLGGPYMHHRVKKIDTHIRTAQNKYGANSYSKTIAWNFPKEATYLAQN